MWSLVKSCKHHTVDFEVCVIPCTRLQSFGSCMAFLTQYSDAWKNITVYTRKHFQSNHRRVEDRERWLPSQIIPCNESCVELVSSASTPDRVPRGKKVQQNHAPATAQQAAESTSRMYPLTAYAHTLSSAYAVKEDYNKACARQVFSSTKEWNQVQARAQRRRNWSSALSTGTNRWKKVELSRTRHLDLRRCLA